MAFALTRSLGGLQRLANRTALPGVVFASLVQPASITSLLAWHTKHINDHRKLYSSDDKQQQPQQAAHGQAESNSESSTSKSQQPGPASATGTAVCLLHINIHCTALKVCVTPVTDIGWHDLTGEPVKTLLQDPVDFFALVTQPWRSFLVRLPPASLSAITDSAHADICPFPLLQNNLTVMTIKKRVETSFEEDDFLEGAKDAWFAGTLPLSPYHAYLLPTSRSCELSPETPPVDN